MRFLRPVLFAFPIVAAPLAGAAPRAETLGNARVGFSAERVLTIDGKSYVGKMWHMPGEQRHEQDLPALKAIFILHHDSTIGDVILPKLHTVVEFALPRELSVLDDAGLLRTPVARDTIDGVETIKYAIDQETPQGHGTGWLWLSDDGIPMKCEATFTGKKGKASSIRWELRHVKTGHQDTALFGIPKGYAKLSAEAAAPLLGMRMARPQAK